jgi:hypothetical protein
MVRKLRRMPVFGDFRRPTGFGNYGFRNGLATLTTTRGLAAVAELGDQGCLLKLAHGPEALAFAAHGYDVPALSSLMELQGFQLCIIIGIARTTRPQRLSEWLTRRIPEHPDRCQR